MINLPKSCTKTVLNWQCVEIHWEQANQKISLGQISWKMNIIFRINIQITKDSSLVGVRTQEVGTPLRRGNQRSPVNQTINQIHKQFLLMCMFLTVKKVIHHSKFQTPKLTITKTVLLGQIILLVQAISLRNLVSPPLSTPVKTKRIQTTTIRKWIQEAIRVQHILWWVETKMWIIRHFVQIALFREIGI